MMAKTHLITSMSVGVGLLFLSEDIMLFLFEEHLAKYYLFGIILGSLLPDIDEKNSYIGSRIKPVAFLVENIFGHRGITHRFIFVLFFIVTGFLMWNFSINIKYTLFVFGVGFGVLFHQIGDMLIGSSRYKGGIKDYYYPFLKKRGKRTYLMPRVLRGVIGGFMEYIYLVISMFVLIGEVYLIMGKNLLN